MFNRLGLYFLYLGCGVLWGAGTGPAVSHEFWIDPVQFTPKTGASVPIVFRIGQNFQGDTYPYVRELDRRFSIIDRTGEHAIKTLDGEDPAAEIVMGEPGLSIVVHQRAPETVVFETFERFKENLIYEGQERLIEAHVKSGRPLATIRDSYARYAKALISVGSPAAGQDRAVGLPLELVAENNPYQAATGQPLTVRLLHNGKPLAGSLVKCFNRDDPKSPRLVRSDAEGRVTFEAMTAGETLISAVHMTEPQSAKESDWDSLWATLSFTRS
jgi:cobalt/nickel transport protein